MTSLRNILILGTLSLALVSGPVSAACVKAIAGVGYEARVRWINDDGKTVKKENVRLGQRKCGPDDHIIAVRTKGAALAKGATIIFGTLATTVAAAGACAVGPVTCSVASNLPEAALSGFLTLPGKNNTFYYAKPKKKNVCLTGSVFSPKARERNGKGKRHCKKGT